MSTDKCPHCGADTIQSPARDFLCWSRHGDHGIIQSDCCKVRAELATTKRDLEKAKADSESWQKQSERFEKQLLETADELAATKRELEKSKSDAASWEQQAEQRMDDANEFGRKLEEAQKELAATKRELELEKSHSDVMRSSCDFWTKKAESNECRSQDFESFRKENDILRALLPKLGAPCVYCGLTEIGKCERGFPGCAQADDLMCADKTIHGDVLDRLRKSEARVRELEGFVRTVRDDFDCDHDAHKWKTFCRTCEASKLIGEAMGGGK